MKITHLSKGIAKSEALEAYTEKKLEKLENYYGEKAECKVVYRQEGKLMVCEITILIKGDIVRCENSHEDVYVAVNKAVETIWGNVRKAKAKVENRRREKAKSKKEVEITHPFTLKEIVRESEYDIRYKKLRPDTMSVYEAITAMEMVGHSFYIFVNEETDRNSVVYKRDTNKHGESYGLINIKE